MGDLVLSKLGYHRQYENCTIFASAEEVGYVADPSQVCEVDGDILIKYKTIGAELSGLGYSTSDEAWTADEQCCFNTFQHGAMYWTPSHGAFYVTGDIYRKWLTTGGEAGGMGYPISDETPTADKQCRFNTFHNGGSISWTAAHGSYFIFCAIYKKWMAQGGQVSGWGHPITDETHTSDDKCRYTIFNNNCGMFWTPETGVCMLYGEIYRKWLSIGRMQGYLAYPVTDELSAASLEVPSTNLP